MDDHVRNEMNHIKDEIRNMKADYIKKDDLDYRRTKEQTDRNAEELAGIRITVKNTNTLLEKNNTLTENLNISNVRLTSILENITDKVDTTGQNVKELSNKVNKIDIETSKNSDSRLTGKQIIVALTVAILMLFIGAGLAQSGIR